MYQVRIQQHNYHHEGGLTSGRWTEAPGNNPGEALDHVERYLKRGFVGLISANGVQRQVIK